MRFDDLKIYGALLGNGDNIGEPIISVFIGDPIPLLYYFVLISMLKNLESIF